MKTQKTWWWIAGIFVFMMVFLGMPQTQAQAAYKVKYDKNIQDQCLTNGKYIYYLATGRIDGKSQHILYRVDRNYQNKTIISTFCSAREEEDRKTLEDVNANNYSIELICYKNGKITLLTGDVELEFGYIDVKSGKYKMLVSGPDALYTQTYKNYVYVIGMCGDWAAVPGYVYNTKTDKLVKLSDSLMGVQIDKKNNKIYYAVMTKYGGPTDNNGHYRIMQANLDGSKQKVKYKKLVASEILDIQKDKIIYKKVGEASNESDKEILVLKKKLKDGHYWIDLTKENAISVGKNQIVIKGAPDIYKSNKNLELTIINYPYAKRKLKLASNVKYYMIEENYIRISKKKIKKIIHDKNAGVLYIKIKNGQVTELAVSW